MSNFTPSRLGQRAGTGDAQALLLEIFGGEVLAAFERNCQMRGLHRIFALNGAKSLKFPRTGRATASYHTPGAEIVGGVIQHDDIVLTSDDKLISNVFIADVDEAMNHFDVRQEYVRQLSEALAVQFDQNAMRAVIKAARDAGKLGDGGGSNVVAATFATTTDAEIIRKALIDAKLKMDEKHVRVDSKPVYAMLKTAQWYLLANSDKALNRDYNGGSGSIQKSGLTTIDGIQVMKSNISPFGLNDTANGAIPARYQANYTNTVATVWSADAIGTAEVMPVSTQDETTVRHQGTLLVSRWMGGTDVFRSNEAVEVKTA